MGRLLRDVTAVNANHTSGKDPGHHRTTCYNVRRDRREQLASAGSVVDSNEGESPQKPKHPARANEAVFGPES
eukprot:12769071-Heterocapsa_arctica.AAC.1